MEISKKMIFSALLLSSIGASAKINKPNIIFILVDDLGYGDLSCQGCAKDIHTPNIDKIFNEGIRFTNFYANCPVSSPSRASLLTGRYPDMVGVPGVIRTQENDSWGYLSKDAVLLPQLLHKQGYKTSIIGKWHLGLEAPNIPTKRGFDYFHGFLGDMMEDYYTHLRGGHNYMRENEKVVNPKGHATEVFTQWAIDYINQQKKDKPFFMYLAYNAPHNPFQPPVEWLNMVKKREPNMTEKRAKIVGLVEHLDYNIGKLYDQLKKNGQLENTLIIFTSDNGGHLQSQANNGIFRGGKEDMYEGGIHVAGSFYWKGKIQPRVCDNFVMLMDMFPTICDLAGAPITHKIDGMSVLPLMKGEEQCTDDRIVHWVRREGNFRNGGHAYYATRYKNMKLMNNSPIAPLELFNLKTDIVEQHPVTDKKNKDFKYLYKQMIEHIRVSGAIPWTKPSKE